jgi:hypothetical protein
MKIKFWLSWGAGIVTGTVVLSFIPRSVLPAVLIACLFLAVILLVKYEYGTKWRVSVTTAVVALGLPAIFAVLATSGETSSAFAWFSFRPGTHRDTTIWSVPGAVCLLGIPMLVVVIPEFLRSKGRPWRDSSPVPAWLAGFAAFLTAAYILTLHFGGGGLAEWHLGALSVAAFGTAVLLAPFYRVVANTCWKAGIAVVFDPVRWWSAWCMAYREMKGTTGGEAGSNDQLQADDAVGEPKASPGAS